jgi:hypothetical protein
VSQITPIHCKAGEVRLTFAKKKPSYVKLDLDPGDGSSGANASAYHLDLPV